ncbi:MAG: DUF4058 family protein [Leptolyngbyaceae cyanobacterium]
MSFPFPGMAHFIEQPDHWASFHGRLIVALANVSESHPFGRN